MITSLYTGLTGIDVHQEWLNLTGDNIANINTIGFKKSRITFESAMNVEERRAVGPRTCRHSRGGIDGKQIGLGVRDRTIDVIHSQGLGFEDSDKVTDVAISGDGYFILADANGGLHYTRAGAFDFDAKRDLVNPANGMYVQGWMAAWDNVAKSFGIDLASPISGINIKLGEILPARATSKIALDGNLDAKTPTAIPSMIIEKALSLRSLSQCVDRDFVQLNPTATTWLADWQDDPHRASTISIVTTGTSGTKNYTSRPLSTYTTLNELMKEIDNSSGVTISYDQERDLFTISADVRGDKITLGSAGPAGYTSLWKSMRMPEGTHETLKDVEIKFTRLLDAQHPDRHYYRWEVVDVETGEPIPMVASAVTSSQNMGANGTNKVSNASVQFLDLTQPFAAAGFDERIAGTPWNWNSVIRIRSSAYASQGFQGSWTSRKLADYVSVDQFIAEVNAQDAAPVTMSYDPVSDTFTVINDAPGTAVLIEELSPTLTALPANDGFVSAAKFQTYTEPTLPVDFLWSGQTASVANSRVAVFESRGNYAAKGIIQLDDNGKVIANYIDTDENKNKVLDRSTEIPSDLGAYSEIDSMPPRVFSKDIWSHTTRSRGTGKDFMRLYNGQIRESVFQNIVPGPNNVITFDRNDVDPTRLYVKLNNRDMKHSTDPKDSNTWRFEDNMGPGGVDQIVFNAASNFPDALIELNYVRLGHSNVVPADVFIPNGNEGPESITFTPNTGQVTNYMIYSPDDEATTRGFVETADGGDAVTTYRLAKEKYLCSVPQQIIDSQGEAMTLTFVFEKLDTKYWLWTVRNPAEDANNPEGLLSGYGTLIYNYDGTYNRALSQTFQSPSDPATYDGDNGNSETGRAATLGYRGIYIDQPELAYPFDAGGSPPPEAGAAIIRLDPDFRNLMEQADLIRKASAVKVTQDGYKMGILESVSTIDEEGIIYGNYTNGLQMPRAKLALAQFNNPGGLARESGTMFAATANSGEADIVSARDVGSSILSKKLERSNVDLAAQFIEMIIAERGFMANSRTISQADRVLMDIMRLRM